MTPASAFEEILAPRLEDLSADLNRFLNEDLGTGDVTTDGLVPSDARMTASLICREAGIAAAGPTIIDSCSIPNIDPAVFPAISGGVIMQPFRALGVLESFSVAAVTSAGLR